MDKWPRKDDIISQGATDYGLLEDNSFSKRVIGHSVAEDGSYSPNIGQSVEIEESNSQKNIRL